MKVIAITYRDPVGNVQTETFDQNEVKIHSEAGWLKMTGKDGTPVRWMPSDKVCLIQFGEKAEEPRIVRPDQVAQPLRSVPQ